MNSRGQIIITDLMLYVLVLVLILGMTTYALNNINANQVVTISNYEVNQILQNTVDTLVKTEGTPNNWDNLDSNDIKTIGLKKNSSATLVSYNKLIKLKNNDYLLDEFIPEGIGYSLTVSSKDTSQEILHIAKEYSLSNKNNIYSRQVPIIIDYGYDIYTININNDTNYCPYNHNNLSQQWSCKPFSINKTSLDNGIYYIITDTDADYEISNTHSQRAMGNIANKVQINSQLNSLVTDNDTVYIHIKNTNSSYLVYDCNNQESHLNSIYNPETYLLNLTVYN